MRIRTVIGAVALAATVVASSLASVASAAPTTRPTILAIVDRSAADNPRNSLTDHNWGDYDILRAAVVTLPGLKDAVEGLSGATVFAPTDEAFRLLVADVTNTSARTLTEAKVLQTLLDVAGVANLNNSGVSGTAALTQTVLYHVSPTVVDLFSVNSPIPTANTVGDRHIRPLRLHPFVVELRDGDRTDRNAVALAGRRISASNGIVVPVTDVLRPLDLVALLPAD